MKRIFVLCAAMLALGLAGLTVQAQDMSQGKPAAMKMSRCPRRPSGSS